MNLNSTDPVAHNNLAAVLADEQKNDDAEKEYQQAIHSDDRYAIAHNNLANLLYMMGRTQEAIDQFMREALLTRAWPRRMWGWPSYTRTKLSLTPL